MGLEDAIHPMPRDSSFKAPARVKHSMPNLRMPKSKPQIKHPPKLLTPSTLKPNTKTQSRDYARTKVQALLSTPFGLESRPQFRPPRERGLKPEIPKQTNAAYSTYSVVWECLGLEVQEGLNLAIRTLKRIHNHVFCEGLDSVIYFLLGSGIIDGSFEGRGGL